MRIGIDARLYGPRVGGGGLGRHVEELIKHLEQLDDQNEYVIFLRRENWDDFNPTNPRFKKVLAPWRWYTLAEQVGMPWVIHQAKLDLLHVPHFNIPLFSKVPLVATIHDLILLDSKTDAKVSTLNPLKFWLKYLGFKFTLAVIMRRACRIIAVSETTRQTIISKFKISPDRVITIHNGFTPSFEDKKIAQLPPLNQPYLLAVGNAYPHKNLVSLLEAFCDTIKVIPQIKLVLVGPDDSFREGLRKAAQQLSISKQVIFTGFVDEEKLDDWYRGASAYIVPSLLEGFALPGLEAQIRSIPVLASKIDAHREVFADSALFFDPQDIKSIGQAIHSIFINEQLRQDLIKKGLENYRRFSWTKAARLTLEIYRHCHAKTNSKKENNAAQES